MAAGLPYAGAAPDLGAFEYSSTPATTPVVPPTPTPTEPPVSTEPTKSVTPPPPAGTTGSAWNGGFIGNVTVAAPAAVTGWKVTVNLPPAVTITGLREVWAPGRPALSPW